MGEKYKVVRSNGYDYGVDVKYVEATSPENASLTNVVDFSRVVTVSDIQGNVLMDANAMEDHSFKESGCINRYPFPFGENWEDGREPEPREPRTLMANIRFIAILLIIVALTLPTLLIMSIFNLW